MTRDAHLEGVVDFYEKRENEEARLETDIGVASRSNDSAS